MALLTVEDVAADCRVSTRTVMRAIRANELKASQLAPGRGCWRIRPEDLDAWIEQRANTSAPARARTRAGARAGSRRGAAAAGTPSLHAIARKREGVERLRLPTPTRRSAA